MEQIDRHQLRVYNPNTGEWFEVQPNEPEPKGGTYLFQTGKSTSDFPCGRDDYPLTPIEVPIQWRLGLAVWVSVPEEVRGRVTGEYRATNGREPHMGRRGHVFRTLSDSGPVVILAPEQPKKSDLELMADMVECLEAEWSEEHGRTSSALEAMKERVRETA